MDKETVINKIHNLMEMMGTSNVTENILRNMSTEQLEQHLTWLCQDYDIEKDEI